MISIAIDGPAGAGKSTIARQTAKKIGFFYFDTGALYRAVGYFVLKKFGEDYTDGDVEQTLPEIKVELKFEDNEQHVYVNGEDVNGKIRSEAVSMAASRVSAIPKVREFLFDLQRMFADKYNVIMDGRDIGTVVLPDAQVKIFLTASVDVRAKRRFDEQKAKGLQVKLDEVKADIERRDYNDTHREIAPLIPAPDSVYVDTSEMTIEENVQAVLDIIKSKIG